MRNLLTSASVAEILRVSQVTLHHWRKKGVGPEWSRRGQFYYYRSDKFEAYLTKIGPLPETDDLNVRRRFFTDAHRPEHKATIAELADRLAVVEKALAKLTADTPKRRKRKRRTPAGRGLAAKGMRLPDPVIPY